MKIRQVLQEVLVKRVQASEIVDVLFGEGQPLDVVNDLIQACADGVASIIRISAVKCIEYDLLVHTAFEVTLHHRQLIEVCEQCQFHGTHVICPLFPTTGFLRIFVSQSADVPHLSQSDGSTPGAVTM